ncbi:MAG: serine/threonine protein kinase [Planctomycetota bacterium]|nr:MAG: serine/threonine protein kinase [Planctomycetota bacterium]
MFRSVTVALMLAAPLCVLMTATHAEDEWPQFRGPDGQGHSPATGLPVRWSESENVTWKTALPGEGHSSPVISGDQVWVTTAITRALSPEEETERLSKIKNPQGLKLVGELTLQAIQLDRASGQVVRTIDLFQVTNPEPKHALNSYASPTPVIAGQKLYCHFGSYGTACIDRSSGAILWRNDSIRVDHQNGPGSSPVFAHDRLIIHFDGTDRQFIAALNPENGETLWETQRSGEMDERPDLKKAYGTPLLVQTESGPQIISPAANWVYAYDPRDGRELWKAAYGQLGFSTVPRPVVLNNKVFIATSYMQSRLIAVKLGGAGDVTESHTVWKSDRQIPQKPSLIALNSRIYFVSDKGIVRCVDAETGEDVWFERLGGDYSASPLAAENHLYFCNQEGLCTVIEAGDTYQELSKNTLDAGIMASPAVAGKALFLRTATHLYRIESK